MDSSLYKRPDKPRTLTVNRRHSAPERALPVLPEPVVVHRTTECHVTPPDVAARMVGYLGPQGDYLTLEPQAGTGNIIQALYDSGHSRFELVAIEKEYSLCTVLRSRFSNDDAIDPIHDCFLDYAANAQGKIYYPRIIMNPPFRRVRKHFAAALSLLGRGGHEVATLVALVPVTFNHDDAETLKELSDDTFSAAKSGFAASHVV